MPGSMCDSQTWTAWAKTGCICCFFGLHNVEQVALARSNNMIVLCDLTHGDNMHVPALRGSEHGSTLSAMVSESATLLCDAATSAPCAGFDAGRQRAARVHAGTYLYPLCPAQGLTLGDSELREYTHGLFGHVARMLGPDFVPYLRTAVAAAMESCSQVR